MTMRRMMLPALLTILAAGSAGAEEPKPLTKAGAWEAYVYQEGGGKVCYAAAKAERTQGGDKGRAGTAMAVTHRPKSPGEVSVIGAYGFKKDSDVEIQIGAMKHTFFAKGPSAWAKDAKADTAIIAAMTKGKEVAVRATPAKGSAVIDVIPLSGFGQVLAAIDKACGVKR